VTAVVRVRNIYDSKTTSITTAAAADYNNRMYIYLPAITRVPIQYNNMIIIRYCVFARRRSITAGTRSTTKAI